MLHSLRNATIGSIRVARRAGINIAITATPPNTIATPPNVTGSVGCTPYNIRAINFDSRNAPATPIMLPTNACPIACRAILALVLWLIVTYQYRHALRPIFVRKPQAASLASR